jgi:type II secretory pathway pseudopilin PulG
VAVILIIAAIAIPSFLQARMSANGASAVDSLRNIDTAEVSYASTYPTLGFAPDLNTLGPGGTAGYARRSKCMVRRLVASEK